MKREQIAEPARITCPDPVNLDDPDRFLFDRGKVMMIPPRTIRTHNDVHVYGRGPLVCDGADVAEWFIMPEQIAEYRNKRKHWRDGLERLIQPAKSFDEPAIWVTDNWSCGYFHWTCDALPRLETAIQHRSLNDFTLLLPHKAKRCGFIPETLKAFDLKRVRILGRFEHLKCRELLVPTHVAPTGSYDPTVMRRMRERFVAHTVAVNKSSGGLDRLYISRQLAGRRRIANESELLPILKEYDFQIVHAEKESWASQIQLASKAKIFVSNHGAGLTNMLAMSPGSRVFEIRDSLNAQLYCYYTLAGAMDLKYYYMLAGRENEKARINHAHMLVDPGKFRATIQQMVVDEQADRLADAA